MNGTAEIRVGSLVRNTDNPDWGPGRVHGHDGNGNLAVRFPWISADGHFDPNRSPVERYLLLPDTLVQCRVDGHEEPITGVVLQQVDAEDDSEILLYRIGIFTNDDILDVTVPETDLLPLPPLSNEPLDILKALAWQGPKRFLRRWRMRLLESRWLEDSGGIPSLLGARIHPLGHQVYAARRVLWDRVPRFILADEVGLGKTIEAGLVIQSLMADKPGMKVLVVAPGAMARQWQTELYLRFGAVVFKHLDGATSALYP